MTKLYKKSEIAFAILWIVLYVVLSRDMTRCSAAVTDFTIPTRTES